MPFRKSTIRWLHRLTALFVIATVAGLLLTALAPAGRLSAFLLIEGGAESTDGESDATDSFEFDSLELFATLDSAEPALHPEYCGRVADETVDTQYTLSPAHLKRGPPLS